VSTAIDNMQRATGFELEHPLALRVQRAHQNWQAHVESSCNTGSAITNLGSQRSNQYLDCVHQHLQAREKEIREQLTFLRGLGWEEEAADALNNELIAIRNMVATQPKDETAKEEKEEQTAAEAGAGAESGNAETAEAEPAQ